MLFINPAKCPAAGKGGEKKGETSACPREACTSSGVKSPKMQSSIHAPCGCEQGFSEEEILARLVMESSLEKGEFSEEFDSD